MTDLEKFIDLYKQFGIYCFVNSEDNKNIIYLNGGWYASSKEVCTDSDKFDGYCGFYSEVVFDENGKFVKQGFWE